MKEQVQNELQNELVKILTDTANTAGQAKDFILSELPDVVSQAMLWHGIHSALMTIFGLGIFIIIYIVIKKYTGVGEKIDPKNEYSTNNHKVTLTHDNDGDDHAGIIFTPILMTVSGIIGMTMLNLTWLKIWIAPKLWLIEYTATLIKG